MSREKNKILPKLRFPKFKDKETWAIKRLCDIGNVLQGYGFPEVLQGKSKGKYPFFKVSDISNAIQNGSHYINAAANYVDDNDLKVLKAKTIPIGTTIFAKIGEAIRLNRRVITTCESLIDNNVAGVKAISENANDYFIFYTLLKIDLIKHSGGAVPSVNKTTLENIPVLVSVDEAERQKITDCLSSLDDLVIAQSQKLEALRTHKKGLMQQLFPTKGEKIPKLRFEEFRSSGEWKKQKLGELLEFKNGINASKEQYGKGVKFINVLDILQNEFITYEKIIGLVDVSDEMVHKFSVNYGDILFQRSSETQEEAGSASVYLDKEHAAIFGGFVIRGKKIGEYEPVFLNKLLQTKVVRDDISSKSGGSTRFNIGQETLTSVEISLPSFSEQQKIAECLFSLDDLITEQAEIIDALKTHKQGLMQGLFPNLNDINI